MLLLLLWVLTFLGFVFFGFVAPQIFHNQVTAEIFPDQVNPDQVNADRVIEMGRLAVALIFKLIFRILRKRADQPDQPKRNGTRVVDNSGALMLTPARNSFEILVIIAVPLVGFFSLAMGQPIFGLQSPIKELFYVCLVLGTGMVVLSMFMPMPMTLQVERTGMRSLASLLLPYSIGLIINLIIIENSMLRHPTWILFIGYGMACAIRALQITHHMRQYDRAGLVGA